jgi:hypothetical protein
MLSCRVAVDPPCLGCGALRAKVLFFCRLIANPSEDLVFSGLGIAWAALGSHSTGEADER